MGQNDSWVSPQKSVVSKMDLCTERSPVQNSTTSSANMGYIARDLEKDGEDNNSDRSRHEPDPEQYPPTWRLVIIMFGLCLAVFCMALDNTIMVTAIPKITDQFQSVQDIGWYGSAYLLTICCLTIFFGKLYTFFTIKWVYIVALAVFETGSLICGLTPNSLGLILGRTIAGMGSAGILSGALTITAQIIPLEKRPLCISLINGLFCISGVTGPFIGGAFTDYVTWRWCFYINIPLGGCAALVILFFVDGPRPIRHAGGLNDLISQLDFVGLLFFFPAVICLLLALEWGGTQYPWNDGRLIGLLVAFVSLLSIFLIVQYWQQEKATVPPRLMKNRDLWGSSIFCFCISGALLAITYYLPTWFQIIKGVSATKSGLMTIPMILGIIISSILSAFLVGKVGYYTPFMYATPVISAIGAGLLSTFKIDSGPAQWIGFQVLLGIGFGLGMSQPMVVVQAVLKPDEVPHAIAIATLMESIGGSVAISVAQNLFQNQLVKSLAREAPRVDVYELMATGITKLRDHVSPDVLNDVLNAYNSAITRALYVGAALSALGIIGAVPIQWVSVKEKETQKAEPI